MTEIEKNEIMPKNFDDLIHEVHEKGLCGECGGCVSFCSASEIKAIEMPESGPPRYYNKDNCLKCGICYLVCPQTKVLTEELHEKFKFKPPIGNFNKVASARATDQDILKNATDGGVVTAILCYLLDQNLIHGALVSKKVGPFSRVPFLATTKEELIEAAGSHFSVSGQVVHLEKYNTFIPTVSELKNVVDSDMLDIAIVGTPCQIHSIRKMQEMNILPAHVIKYTLGLFCNMNFSFDESGHEVMESKFAFSFSDITKMNVKENLILEFKDKVPVHLHFDDIQPFCRRACLGCTDFSNIYADISFGGLGSENGFTTVITRTEKGMEIYREAMRKGYIKEPIDNNTSVKKSEMLAKVIGFSKQKVKRASNYLAGKI
ncbi:MAG: Coenzyme F420 hydrogenase/dehydrogenase, beta subunit C-terminal domain [Promethearchaeota archaeon]